jgi:hypothetical protein
MAYGSGYASLVESTFCVSLFCADIKETKKEPLCHQYDRRNKVSNLAIGDFKQNSKVREMVACTFDVTLIFKCSKTSSRRPSTMFTRTPGKCKNIYVRKHFFSPLYFLKNNVVNLGTLVKHLGIG